MEKKTFVTPKSLNRSLDNEKSWSYVTAKTTDGETIALGWMHYYGLPHLAGTIASVLSNNGKLEKYWGKSVEVTIEQGNKVCNTTIKVRGYHY